MKVSNCCRKFLSGEGLVVSFLLMAQEVSAQGDFYKGKTIKLLAATQAGGTSDMRIRAILPFLEKYIPGNPTFVVEYMPGGRDRKAANYLYNTARPDGLTIGGLGGGFVSNAVAGEAGVMYDIDRFIYLRSGFSRFSAVFVTRRDAGLDSLEKLRTVSGVRIGADSVGHHHYIVGGSSPGSVGSRIRDSSRATLDPKWTWRSYGTSWMPGHRVGTRSLRERRSGSKKAWSTFTPYSRSLEDSETNIRCLNRCPRLKAAPEPMCREGS